MDLDIVLHVGVGTDHVGRRVRLRHRLDDGLVDQTRRRDVDRVAGLVVCRDVNPGPHLRAERRRDAQDRFALSTDRRLVRSDDILRGDDDPFDPTAVGLHHYHRSPVRRRPV